jgi:DNA-binding MarR family transcriptional regulator
MVRRVSKTRNSQGTARKRPPAKAAQPALQHRRVKQEQTSRPAVAAAASAQQRPTGKLGDVLTAVAAKPGATLIELVSLTGWQPHTARAALTRLRQRGFKVHLREAEGRKAYHLTQAARR